MTIYDSSLNMTAGQSESFAVNLTSASAYLIKTGNAVLNGIVVNSHTSGTIEVRDGIGYAVGNVVMGTMTLGATERFIPCFGARFGTGMVIKTRGTVDVTVLYR